MSDYGQFCPVSKAAEVLCERWTPLIIRELLAGSSRFNEIRRGLPTCSPALLSKRLRDLEGAGVITREAAGRLVTYQLTAAGWELFPLIKGLGEWGQRWARSNYSDAELDPGVLMWDVRRYLVPGLVDGRVVLLFHFPGAPAKRRSYWVLVDPEQVDVCLTDPGIEVDVTITAQLRALTRVWMGDATFLAAVRDGEIEIDGPSAVTRRIPDWFGQHPILGPVKAALG
ncbi:MAG TPA: helix-turn-helix domain-containing protein [Mycobacteriales bacterium]|nr:helix-turn-helix domain-containing protein [Mycobacteriales bacterium]